MSLEAEGALDLVPDDDAQVDARRHEDEKDEPEAKLSALRLPLAIPVGAAPGSMQPVRPLDRNRIELQRLIDHLRAAGRLGHARSINALASLVRRPAPAGGAGLRGPRQETEGTFFESETAR
jgi:hypothetical protein